MIDVVAITLVAVGLGRDGFEVGVRALRAQPAKKPE